MKFNLLIVDDEAPIRKGLSQFINWNNLDCCIMATANDGKEAIELLNNHQIHIVITDIRMPDLDGLKLSAYIHQNFPKIRVIILTGFADFEYAQSAIQYGVSDYIVKPVAKDKIMSSVQKAQKEIITLNQDESEKEEELSFLREQLLQELTVSSNNESILKKLHHYGISLQSYQIVSFQLLSNYSQLASLKEIILNSKISGYCYRYNSFIIFIYMPDEIYKDLTLELMPVLKEISNIIYSLYNEEIFIGISSPHESDLEYAIAVSESIKALSQNFYSVSNISVYFETEYNSKNFISTENTLMLYELETEIIQQNFEAVYRIIQTIFNQLKAGFVNSADAKNVCMQIYYIGFRILIKKRINASDENLVQEIISAKQIYHLEIIIQDFINNIELLLVNKKKQYSKLIHAAIQYIDTHQQSPLHLKLIADKLFVNPSYLSRLFKKEVNQSITEYINTSRIEKAKELLSDSNNLAYEIAEQVGFNDPAYFSSTFKKYTGVSPKEYKNKH